MWSWLPGLCAPYHQLSLLIIILLQCVIPISDSVALRGSVFVRYVMPAGMLPLSLLNIYDMILSLDELDQTRKEMENQTHATIEFKGMHTNHSEIIMCTRGFPKIVVLTDVTSYS